MSEQRQARLAFIGCGGFATASIFPCIHQVPQIDLVAVCDILRERAERNARHFGARRLYTDLEEMLDKEELDGVFVIGPAPQQYELAPHVLRRGIPVYVEKPAANKASEARELAELAKAHRTWGQVGFMKRFAYVYLMAKEILARPEFGPLHMVNCKFGQGPYPQIWGIDSAKRAFLIGQCVHIFDLIRFFGGDVAAVQAVYHEATPTQFAYLINAEYVSGAVGQVNINGLECTQGFRDIIERLELVGLGTSVFCDEKQHLRWLPRDEWSKAIPQTGRYIHAYEPSWTGTANTRANYGYLGEVEHFALRCLGEREGGPDLWDSYRAQQIGEAVYDSAHGAGRVVVGEG
jgi:predicted dehydrogenase